MMRQLVVLPTVTPCSPDVVAPVMTACPANMNLTTTGTSAVATWTAPTATDACSTPIVSFSTSPTVGLTNGGAFPIGTTTVSYMAMDGANNMAMCNFTVTVTSTNSCATDAVAPVLTACPATLNLTTAGTTATASWTAPTATDACSTPSVTFATSPTTGLTNGGAFPVGTTTVTYTATDAKNNTATCSFNVVVANTNPCTNDLTPPTMTACPANQNLTTTGTTAVASWTAPTATDACSTTSVTFTTMPTTGLTNGGLFPVGTTMVTYMAMDAKNNMSTCSFNIAVINPCTNDVTPPTLTACPTNRNLTTAGTTAVASWTAPTATDACSTPSVSFTTSPTAGLTNGGAFPVGTTTVSYMAMDVRNNMSTCSFNVIVTNTNTCTNDITPPVINNCPATQNLTTTGTTAVASWVSPTATDNCSTPTLTFTTSPTAALTNGGAFPVGTTTVTYMAMDANNNMTTCSFDIVVGQTNACATDAIAPVMTACPANLNLTTTGTTAVATWTAPTATDNCGTPSVTFTTMPTTGLTNGGAFPVGTTMVTYMAMDAKNNMSTCSFNVAVTNTNTCTNDVTKPVLTACPANLNLTTTGTTAVANWTAPTATDNCSTPTVTFATSPTTGLTKGGAFPIGTTTVTYTAKDAKLNTATCSFNVVVTNTNPCATDVTKPVLTACPANLNLTTTGTTAVANWTAPTATDNCSTPTVTFATSPTVGLTKGGAFPIGTTKVTYTAKDAKLNTSTCSFTVTVSNPCATDVTKPVLTVCPANLNLTTTGTTAVANWTAPTATDNCSTPTVTFATSPTVGLLKGGAFPIGTTTVTYTAKDAKLNTATCSFTVTVSNPCATDVTKPVLTACPANQNLTTTGTTAVATWTAPTATDNCSTPTVTFATSPTVGLFSGAFFPTGTTTVTYTAKDAKLNTSTCSFTVTVSNPCATDVTKPVISGCPANQALTTSYGFAVSTTWTAPTATDNCTLLSLTSNYVPGSFFNVGTTTVTYTAKDAKLNTATCSFNVTVTQPTSTCTGAGAILYADCFKAGTTISLGVGSYTLSQLNALGFSDNVLSDLVVNPGFKVTLYNNSDLTGTSVVLTSNPNCLTSVNFNDLTSSVKVECNTACTNDVTPPVITNCPTNQSLTTSGTSTVTTWTAPTAIDNCSASTLTSNYAPGSSFNIGTTTVVYTAKDAKLNAATCSFNVTVTQTVSACPGVGAILYAGCSKFGTPISLETGSYTLSQLVAKGLSDNSLSDLVVNSGYKVTLYDNSDLTGAIMTLTATPNCLPSYYNDLVSSVKVECLSTAPATDICSNSVTLFEGCSLAGKTVSLAPGSYTASQLSQKGFSDNILSDMVVPAGFTAYLYDLDNFAGTPTIVTSNPNCLTTLGFNDKMSSIVISCSSTSLGASSAIDEKLCHILSSGARSYDYVQPDLNYATNQPILDVDMQILLNTGVFGWVFKSNNDGTYRLSFKGKVATVSNASMSNMASIVMSDWTGADNQRWIVTITPYPIGGLPTYKFKAKHSGLVMTQAAASQYVQSPDIAGYTLSQLFISNASYCDLTIYGSNQSVLTMDAKADMNQTRLDWVNNTGVKNKDFTVERFNTTTNEFETIAVVPNNSNDVSATYYSAYDKTPSEGDNIYRIKLTFLDGSTRISNVKKVTFKDLNSVYVFPNPANDMINIDLPSYKGQNVDVYLFNSLGQQKLFNKVEKLDNTRIELDATNLPVGNYMIRVTSKDKRDVVKPVVIAH